MTDQEKQKYESELKERFQQPEFILQKIACKKGNRLSTFVVKNISFNTKPIFIKGGIYSVKECMIEDGATNWISSKATSAVCVDIMNHYRNVMVTFNTLEDLVKDKEKKIINRVLVALKLKKPVMIPPAMPEQILVQLVGTIANEGAENAKSK